MGIKKITETQVLIVDDDEDLRQIMADSFSNLGYNVAMASSGNEAFEMAKSKPMDVVISDIRMPNGDGFETLERLRSQLTDIPIVILITGYPDFSPAEALAKGASGLFIKPFEFEALRKTVVRMLTPVEERWSRKDERFDLELNVRLQFESSSQELGAKAVNLGRGGFFVATDQKIKVGDLTSFTFNFEESESLGGRGIVRWIRRNGSPDHPAGCGIEFTYLTDADMQRVLSLISKTNPKAFIPEN